MTSPERLKARAGLDPARAAIARLDRHHSSEDLAADLIEIWQSVETSLRLLLGSTSLAGQPLIREVRQRQLIDFDLANTLVEFQTVNDRLQNIGYAPTEADIASARVTVSKLDAAVTNEPAPSEALRAVAGKGPAAGEPIRSGPITGEVRTQSRPAADAKAAEDPFADLDPVKVVAPPRRFPLWALIAAGVVVIAALGVGSYFMFRPKKSDSLERGIQAYQAGQREVAVSSFTRAAREDTTSAMPHIYLARMAREVGNTTLAGQELQLALNAEPHNAVALREMGANLFTQGNYDLARRFYVRAVEEDPTDKTALGYLGCTLVRLNRVDEATKFFNRAGPGPWSNCTPANPQSANSPTTNPR